MQPPEQKQGCPNEDICRQREIHPVKQSVHAQQGKHMPPQSHGTSETVYINM